MFACLPTYLTQPIHTYIPTHFGRMLLSKDENIAQITSRYLSPLAYPSTTQQYGPTYLLLALRV
jgi:hypothetical protein